MPVSTTTTHASRLPAGSQTPPCAHARCPSAPRAPPLTVGSSLPAPPERGKGEASGRRAEAYREQALIKSSVSGRMSRTARSTSAPRGRYRLLPRFYYSPSQGCLPSSERRPESPRVNGAQQRPEILFPQCTSCTKAASTQHSRAPQDPTLVQRWRDPRARRPSLLPPAPRFFVNPPHPPLACTIFHRAEYQTLCRSTRSAPILSSRKDCVCRGEVKQHHQFLLIPCHFSRPSRYGFGYAPLRDHFRGTPNAEVRAAADTSPATKSPLPARLGVPGAAARAAGRGRGAPVPKPTPPPRHGTRSSSSPAWKSPLGPEPTCSMPSTGRRCPRGGTPRACRHSSSRGTARRRCWGEAS